MSETWATYPSNPYYEVSDQGRVRSVDRVTTRSDGSTRRLRGKIISPSGAVNQYRRVILSADQGEKYTALVHRMVAEAFLGPCPAGQMVLHWDDDRTNNRLLNLRYGNRAENRADSRRNGRKYMEDRTHCKRGHEFTPENTIWHGDGRRWRRCRTCTAAKRRTVTGVR